jgi:hypothetical protein
VEVKKMILEEITNRINERIEKELGEKARRQGYLFSNDILPIIYEELGFVDYYVNPDYGEIIYYNIDDGYFVRQKNGS